MQHVIRLKTTTTQPQIRPKIHNYKQQQQQVKAALTWHRYKRKQPSTECKITKILNKLIQS